MSKTKKIIIIVVCVILGLGLISTISSCRQEFNKVVKIKTVEDFMEISYQYGKDTNKQNKYILKNDLDFSGVTYTNPLMTLELGDSIAENEFQHVFDGNGHTIKNLTITGKYASLFGALGEDAQVLNLKLENVNITGEQIGAIFGASHEDTSMHTGVIKNVEVVSGTIGDGTTSIVGGIGGNAPGKVNIEDCVNRATINCKTFGGGMLGYAYQPGLNNNTNYGEIKSTKDYAADNHTKGAVGGIIGDLRITSLYNDEYTVANQKNYGTINAGELNYAGGVIGYVSYAPYWASGDTPKLKVTNCVNEGSISAKEYAGGIIGMGAGVYDDGPAIDYIDFNSCTNKASVYANRFTGGIVGSTVSCTNFKDCKNLANAEAKVGGGYKVGGIVGEVLKTRRTNRTATFENCENAMTIELGHQTQYQSVSAFQYASGICGFVEDGVSTEFKTCSNSGNLKTYETISINATQSSYYYLGGIVGYVKNSKIQYCSNSGNIEGNQYVGGIASKLEQSQDLDFYRNSNNGNIVAGSKGTSIYGMYVGCLVGEISFANGVKIIIMNGSNTGDIYLFNKTILAGGLVGNMSYDNTVDELTATVQLDNNQLDFTYYVYPNGNTVSYYNAVGSENMATTDAIIEALKAHNTDFTTAESSTANVDVNVVIG